MSDTLSEILEASRTWLDTAARHQNAGEVSAGAAAARLGLGYATLASAHAAAAALDSRQRSRTDSPTATAVPLPTRQEAFPSALRPVPSTPPAVGE